MGCSMGTSVQKQNDTRDTTNADYQNQKPDSKRHNGDVPKSTTKKDTVNNVPKEVRTQVDALNSEPPRPPDDPDPGEGQGRKKSEPNVVPLEAAGDGGTVDPAVHGAKIEDRFYNNKAFQKPDVDTSDPQQQTAAVTIQTKYRQHHAKQVVQTKRETKAATKIQSGYRGFQDRQKVKVMRQDINEKKQSVVPETETETEETPEEPTAAPAQTPEQRQQAEAEEVIDIDLTDPEVENAAVKIQASFKGYKARKEVKDMKDQAASNAIGEAAPEAEQGEEEIDIDLDDPEVQAAATKIQASFRGHKVRKDMKDDSPKQEQSGTPDKTEKPQEEEEEVDIDLDDPEVQAAATKIQASFRGHQVRKDMKKEDNDDQPKKDDAEPEKTTEPENPAEQEEEVDIDLDDPEVQAAATKIQASFRGHMVRKDKKDSKVADQTEETVPAEEKEQAEQEVTEEQQEAAPVEQEEAAPAEAAEGEKPADGQAEETAEPEVEGQAEETAKPAEEGDTPADGQAEETAEPAAEGQAEETAVDTQAQETVEPAAEETAAAPEGEGQAEQTTEPAGEGDAQTAEDDGQV